MKLAVTGIGPGDWPATVMVHVAVPVALVVPGQVCADEPVPSVKTTVLPLIPVPDAGSSVASTPEKV